MANVSIKNVPDDVVAQLRARANTNHRSIQSELLALVCAAMRASAPKVNLTATAAVAAGESKSIEQIADEHRATQPKPIADAPAAVDIVRRDRDARQ